MARKRKYELKARATRQADTRRRIVEAAMALHEELGPARTSVSAVAERAGVQRLTLYRHFPDELALLKACGGHYRSLHPPPDLESWRRIAAPGRRLTSALRQLYRHYRETGRMWAVVLRDAQTDLALHQASEPRRRFLQQARETLAAGWDARDRARLNAALWLAVDFHTWNAMTSAGLSEPEMVKLMSDFVRAARR